MSTCSTTSAALKQSNKWSSKSNSTKLTKKWSDTTSCLYWMTIFRLFLQITCPRRSSKKKLTSLRRSSFKPICSAASAWWVINQVLKGRRWRWRRSFRSSSRRWKKSRGWSSRWIKKKKVKKWKLLDLQKFKRKKIERLLRKTSCFSRPTWCRRKTSSANLKLGSNNIC